MKCKLSQPNKRSKVLGVFINPCRNCKIHQRVKDMLFCECCLKKME